MLLIKTGTEETWHFLGHETKRTWYKLCRYASGGSGYPKVNKLKEVRKEFVVTDEICPLCVYEAYRKGLVRIEPTNT